MHMPPRLGAFGVRYSVFAGKLLFNGVLIAVAVG
jgi:hypothetical protein